MPVRMAIGLQTAGLLLVLGAGCGTTRWSDTQRTATEQLLVSDAIDRAVNRVDFYPLAGKRVYLDATALKTTIDATYLASSLRQQMLAHGCIILDKREEADYVVEARSGALGTDHRELLLGVPATRVPEIGPAASVPATIPEIPLAKRTEQRAVAKIALFAYNRATGQSVWQSGTVPVESRVKDLWVLGIGPFQRGRIVDNAKVAQDKALLRALKGDPDQGLLSVTEKAVFPESKEALAAVMERRSLAKKEKDAPSKPKSETKPAEPSPLETVLPAMYIEPVPVMSGPATGTSSYRSDAAAQAAAAAAATNPPQSLTVINEILKELPTKAK